jgi:hypothetical protein
MTTRPADRLATVSSFGVLDCSCAAARRAANNNVIANTADSDALMVASFRRDSI